MSGEATSVNARKNVMMDEGRYTTEIGDYLVVWITADPHTYIAEVVEKEPLRLKITERGPYAHLRDDDFIIRDLETEQLQTDVKNKTHNYLKSEQADGREILSGLKSLGVKDHKIHVILPG